MNNEIIIFHKPNFHFGKFEEPIHINFYINDKICPVRVQKSSFKNESHLTKDPDSIIKIKLPKCDGIPKWGEAISSLNKYFTPYSIGDVKKMYSKTFTYKIRINEVIPLYYIARTLNLENLYRYIEISFDSDQIKPHQLANLYLDCKEKLRQISFPEIISHIELLLEMSPPQEIYFSSIHFVEIILSLQKQRQNREFIRKWLHSVFKEYSKTKLYNNSIYQIVSNHQVVNSNDAFIIWIYSQYFPSMNGDKKFASVLSTYDFTEDDTKIPLTEKQAVFLFENRKKKENLSPCILKLIVPYICALSKSDPSKCFQMFQNMMSSINSIPEFKDNLSLEQLIQLAFIAAHPPNSSDVPFYQNIYSQISEEIRQKAELNQNNNEYIFDNQKEIMKLSWEQLFSTFNFCSIDIFIEICYKWLRKNQKFTEEDLNSFYSLFPFDEKQEKWKVRYSYILFRIFDLLNQQYKFNLASLINPNKFFEGEGNSSLENLFSYILEKNKVFAISPETLNIIHQKINLSKKEQIMLVLLIRNFQVQDYNKKILLPVYEESVENVINILALLKQKEKEKNNDKKNQLQIDDIENDFIINNTAKVARKCFGKLEIPTIISLSTLIPFNTFFGQNEDDDQIVLMNEDRVALYASLSTDFDPKLINFPQLSFRLVSFYLESIKFQFITPRNSPISYFKKNFFVNSPSMVKYIIDIKKEWMKVSIPRFHFHEIGMITICVMTMQNQRTAELLKRSFEYVGINNVNIIFPGDDCDGTIPEDNPVILLKPFENNIDCPLESMVNSFLSRKQPFAMNAYSFFSLINESSNLTALSGLLGFETDNMEAIEWSEPTSGFLPFKENLPILKFESINNSSSYNDYSPNADVYFHSISCQLIKDVTNKVTFANGRLFAVKIWPTFSIFNYDIVIEGDEQSPIYWACLKQMALTTLSLFFDFRLKFSNDST